jgi:hypothetical protein
MNTVDLDELIGVAVKAVARDLVPDPAVPQQLPSPIVRRRRRGWAAGIGVLATAAAVATVLVVTTAGAERQAEPAATPTLGPTVTSLPYVSRHGTPWSTLAFSDPEHGYASGTYCPGTCVVPVARTTDGGRHWTADVSLGRLKYGLVSLYPAPQGVWAIGQQSGRLWYKDVGASTWTQVAAGGVTAAGVVNGTLVAYEQGAVDSGVSPCTVRAFRVRYVGAHEVLRQRVADDVRGPSETSVGADGSLWRLRPNTHACQGGFALATDQLLQVAPPGRDFSPLFSSSPPVHDGGLGIDATDARHAVFGGGGVEVTNDGGRTWRAIPSLGANSDGLGRAVSLGSGRIFFSGGGILHDLKAGVIGYRPITVRLPSPAKSGVRTTQQQVQVDGFTHLGDRWLAMTLEGKFIASADGGRTWHLQGMLPA